MLQLLSYIHWDIDPVLLQLGPFPIRYYSLFFVLGIGCAYSVMKKLYVGKTLTQHQLDSLSVYIVLGTLIGARLGHCLFYEPNYYLSHPSEIVLPIHLSDDGSLRFTGYQGLASHGGAIGILLAMFFYARRFHFSFFSVADKVAMVVPIAGAFIRIGNFFNSEIVGKQSRLPWSIVFEKVDYMPRHPTQLYESACYIGIFVFLWVKFRKGNMERSGYVLGWFLVLTFFVRFVIEFVKAPQENFEQNMFLNMGQLLSIPFILTGLILIYYCRDGKDEKAE